MPRLADGEDTVPRQLTFGPLRPEGERLPALAHVAFQCTLIFFEVVDAFPAVSRTVTVTVKSPLVV